jgi:hypothetical protein
MRPLVAVVTVLAPLVTPLAVPPAFASNIGAGITVTDNLAGDLNPLSDVTTMIPGAGLPPLIGSSARLDSAPSNSPRGPSVPEPVTMFLGGMGFLMLTFAARRRLFGR